MRVSRAAEDRVVRVAEKTLAAAKVVSALYGLYWCVMLGWWLGLALNWAIGWPQ